MGLELPVQEEIFLWYILPHYPNNTNCNQCYKLKLLLSVVEERFLAKSQYLKTKNIGSTIETFTCGLF